MSTTKLAGMESVTSQTIRRRIESGYYDRVSRTSGGHYRVFIQLFSKKSRKISYARVSSVKQKFSIATQKRLLLERYPDSGFIADIASAFNFKRQRLKAILESAMLGYPTPLMATKAVVTTKDRLARSGFELIKWLIELSGGQIEILDGQAAPSEAFDTQELIGFVTIQHPSKTACCNSQKF
ncbi:recombinase family protein [Endozoicomonas sp.]|uniref:recombinase family protein n=1 Tax=Endozoicomonas sp. TaxID=1892382 RepID=UPI00383A2320